MELLVSEIPLGIYVKFRYTLSEGQSKHSSMFNTIFEKATILTIGYEEKDKMGKPTHPHLHFHMLINDKIANIRPRLKRLFKLDQDEREGNSLYSLVEEKDVLDINRFFRYGWKQGGRIRNNEKIDLLKDFAVDVELKCAVEEYSRSCQFNNDKLDRSTRANTYDKIKALFLEKPPTTIKECVRRVREFYIRDGLACNASTMAGYVTTYSLANGLMDPELFDSKVLSLIIS